MSDADSDNVATLPLDALHRAHGGRMVPFAGYAMPVQYTGDHGGIVTEHEWTRTGASLFDVSHMGQLTLSGDGATAALEKLLPADLGALAPGNIRYSLLLNENGGILDDLMVTNISQQGEEAFYVVVNGATKHDDIAWMRDHLPAGVNLEHLEDSALLALQGPNAAAVLDTVFPGIADRLSFMQATGFEWEGAMVGIGRSGYTGEDGFEITLPASHAERLANTLVADERVHPAGLGARDSLRLEAGLPLYGHDLAPDTDPVSAGLGFALSKSRRIDGGWIGHAAVMKILSDGPQRRRVGLVIGGRRPAREGATVHAGESEVGTVTSGCPSPTLGHPIAMAYVDTAHAAEGASLEIEVRGTRLPARVVKLPFVPHNYVRKGA